MLRPFILLLIVTAAIVIRHPAAAAEDPAGSLTLARALALTLERSPELAAFDWDIRAAEARIIQARLRPNPELSLEAEDITGTRAFKSGDEAETTLQLSQLIELGGKRPARIQEAQLHRALADFEYQVKRVAVLRETTERFIELLLAQRRVALAEETVTLTGQAVPLTEQRVEVGKASAVETTRANVGLALAQIAREQARRDLIAAKASLSAQWGETTTVGFDSVTGDLDRMEALPSFPSLVARLGRNPELARWTVERERREATLRLQKAQAAPDITAMAGPRVMGKGDEYTLGIIGFSIPLPIFNRNQGNIAEANALLSKTDPEERAAEARAFAELSVAYQALLRASGEVAILKDSVIPGATQSVELLTSGYEAGRFSQIEILLERRTLFDARFQHLRALGDYHKALAQIEALTAAPVELHRHLEAPTNPKLRTKPAR